MYSKYQNIHETLVSEDGNDLVPRNSVKNAREEMCISVVDMCNPGSEFTAPAE